MLMVWLLGHASLFALIVGPMLLAAVPSHRTAMHAASYVEVAPVRVRPGRRGPS